MEATHEQWEEKEEVGLIRGRRPTQNSNRIISTTSVGDIVYPSHSSSETESLSAEEEEERKGRSRNDFSALPDKNGGTESPHGISGFNGGHVDFLTSKKWSNGNEIVADEIESLSFQNSLEANYKYEDATELKDREVDFPTSKNSLNGDDIAAGEVDSLSFQKSVQINHQGEDYSINLKDGHVDDSLSSKKSLNGSEILAGEVVSPSFQNSIMTIHQDQDATKSKDEELLSFGSSSSKQFILQNGQYTSLENGKTEHGKVKSRDISEQEASELYLERVYEKPPEHEFYCPNCKSCITKVIIRERVPESRPAAVPIPEPVDPVRCTSCFSFLIPAGIWFFPKSTEEEETSTDRGVNFEVNDGTSVPSHHNSNEALQEQSIQVPSVGEGSLPIESVGTTEPSGINIDSKVENEVSVPPQDSNGTLYEKRSQTPTRSIVFSHAESVDEVSDSYLERRVGVEMSAPPEESYGTLYYQGPKTPASDDWNPSVGVVEAASIVKAPEPVEASFNITPITKPSADTIESTVGFQVSIPSHDGNGTLPNQDSSVPGQLVGVSGTVTTQAPASEIHNAGQAETQLCESTTVFILSEGPTIISEPRDANSLEIIKSIVYGGLAEAIASLSIVASAASAGTATLNILVLALANLLGGLFIIGHNLWDLKVDQSRVTSSETNEQVDRYQEVLGKRESFFLHASVAVLSFLVFGLLPPLVYGFSFRQSSNADLKIAAVAASSLFCIILLAIGKAYIQRSPNYIKVVLYYVAIGVGVGGVSYLAGDLIEKLIEKFGWFDSTVAGTLSLPQMSIVKPALETW